MASDSTKRLFRCPYIFCGYASQYGSRDVRRHVMRTHENQKPYKCQKCNYASADSSDLLKHKVVHSERRDFGCMACTFRFKTKSDLHRHFKTHLIFLEHNLSALGVIDKINKDRKILKEFCSGAKEKWV